MRFAGGGEAFTLASHDLSLSLLLAVCVLGGGLPTRLESERWSKRVRGGIFLWNAFLRADPVPRGDLFCSPLATTTRCFSFNELATRGATPQIN